jgi:hypothetical protein
MISAPVTASTPAELAARLASETAKWGPIVKEAGIKQEYPCAGESGGAAVPNSACEVVFGVFARRI